MIHHAASAGAIAGLRGCKTRKRAIEIEREIKFALPGAQLAVLHKAAGVSGSDAGHRRRVVSTYYDTRDHVLRRAGRALRVRSDGERLEQTLKAAVSGPAGIQNCSEWTVELAANQPDLSAFEEHALQGLGPSAEALQLLPLFVTDVERSTHRLRSDATGIEMSVDIGEIRRLRGSPISLPVSEVEFELVGATPLDLLNFLLTLVETVELHPLFPSKAQRGYELLQAARAPTAIKAQPLVLDKAMDIGSAFQRISGGALEQLMGNMAAASTGQAEALHQSRVALRRLRAALSAFRGVLPRQPRRSFSHDFRRLQATLSPARDWQVFCRETLPEISAGKVLGDEALQRLKKAVEEARRSGVQRAATSLYSRDCTKLLLSFQHWLLSLEASRPPALREKLKPFARGMLDASHRELLTDPRRLESMREEERHELRKRAKESRYLAECFHSLWRSKAVSRYLKTMARLQDRLGEANDAVVARDLVDTLEPRILEAADRREVLDWAQSREHQSVIAAQPRWRRAEKLKRFWR